MLLVGYEYSNGSFTDKKSGNPVNYDNVYLYFAKQDPNCHGVCIQMPKSKTEKYYKIKRADLAAACAEFGIKNFDELIKKDITLIYDEFGKIIGIFSIH